MPKLRHVGRIKPRYNPTPNAKERAHHERLIAMPCICCDREGGVFHHLLSRAAGMRWRRDHEWGLPMRDECHRALHGYGNERAWFEPLGIDPVAAAEFLRMESLHEGIL
jgi:hypothetical protein